MQNKASRATAKKKKGEETMNPASCNFSQAKSQSPYLKGGKKQNKHRL
jgi:hypothetical protein